MRIIPKRTKVKVQFYKGIGIYDVILGIVALAFLALTLTSNFPNKYAIALGILIVVAPMYIPIGEIKVYNAIGYAVNLLLQQKHLIKLKKTKNT